MKPAPFKYVEVADEQALLGALSEAGSDARLLAGGQSLVPMMNFRIVSPEVLIDLNRIETMSGVDCDQDALHIGALTRHATLEDSEPISKRCGLIAQAVRLVAHRAVRNRGTLGGTVALAYPGAELPLALMTLGATVLLQSPRGGRAVAIEDFILGALDTVLGEDEYIQGVRVALPPSGAVSAFRETSRRHGDFAIAAAAVVAARDDDGKLNVLHAGISGGTGAPIRLAKLEAAVLAGPQTDMTEACDAAVSGIEVFGDHHYPANYRRHVLKGVLAGALREAIETSAAPHAQ